MLETLHCWIDSVANVGKNRERLSTAKAGATVAPQATFPWGESLAKSHDEPSRSCIQGAGPVIGYSFLQLTKGGMMNERKLEWHRPRLRLLDARATAQTDADAAHVDPNNGQDIPSYENGSPNGGFGGSFNHGNETHTAQGRQHQRFDSH
jgi:hypothetical protein